jgi:glycosyltransferase involved in cell wall biosynthesis
LEVINPPVVVPFVEPEEVARFKAEHNPEGQSPVIGMAARFATEKGVEVLLKAAPEIIRKYPRAVIWFAGPYENILGEEQYFKRLKPQIDVLQKEGHWKFLGLLSSQVMAAFYPNLDMLVIPSLNSTESFGLVQIEAMMNGVPAIASNLPGVRQPVLRHQMGRVIPIGDAQALAQAVIELAGKKKSYADKKDQIRALYSPNAIAQQYEELFKRIQMEVG